MRSEGGDSDGDGVGNGASVVMREGGDSDDGGVGKRASVAVMEGGREVIVMAMVVVVLWARGQLW